MKITATVSRRKGTWGFGSCGADLTVEAEVPGAENLDSTVAGAFDKAERLVDIQLTAMDPGIDPNKVLKAVQAFDRVGSMSAMIGMLDGKDDWSSATKVLVKEMFQRHLEGRA